jgi:hypothetical protein
LTRCLRLREFVEGLPRWATYRCRGATPAATRCCKYPCPKSGGPWRSSVRASVQVSPGQSPANSVDGTPPRVLTSPPRPPEHPVTRSQGEGERAAVAFRGLRAPAAPPPRRPPQLWVRTPCFPGDSVPNVAAAALTGSASPARLLSWHSIQGPQTARLVSSWSRSEATVALNQDRPGAVDRCIPATSRLRRTSWRRVTPATHTA